jgi:septal ring factor EnvC (AmiA/AmiB activator)
MTMTRANQALVILLVAALGLWGCAQGPANANGAAKALEGKLAKLEEEYRAVTSARDQVRKKLAEAEEQRIKAQQDLEQLRAANAKEREELRQELSQRTGERDALQGQFEQFRKGVRSLLNQADSAASGLPPAPTVSSTNAAEGGKSS